MFFGSQDFLSPPKKKLPRHDLIPQIIGTKIPTRSIDLCQGGFNFFGTETNQTTLNPKEPAFLILDLLKMLGKSAKHILPNGGETWR